MNRPGEPAGRWSDMLARWAIPERILDGAPAKPYFFDPAVFTAAADEAIARDHDSISDEIARQALPASGTVLDVGAGAGTASLRLGAARVVAVDLSRELLAAFSERAAGLGLASTTIEGSWPDVAARTPAADVVVCHHVIYNVADLAGFASALADHAQVRVVVELTASHPMAWLAPYWQALHDVRQPTRPTAADALSVLEELGLEVHQRTWTRRIQMIGESGDDQIARIARRLCLPASRLDELRRVLATTPPPTEREVVTLWW